MVFEYEYAVGTQPCSGCQLTVLHPDSLHPDSFHGDQVCDGGSDSDPRRGQELGVSLRHRARPSAPAHHAVSNTTTPQLAVYSYWDLQGKLCPPPPG